MSVPPPLEKTQIPVLPGRCLKHWGTGPTGSRHVLLKLAQQVATQEGLEGLERFQGEANET